MVSIYIVFTTRSSNNQPRFTNCLRLLANLKYLKTLLTKGGEVSVRIVYGFRSNSEWNWNRTFPSPSTSDRLAVAVECPEVNFGECFKKAVELGYNIMTETEYFVSILRLDNSLYYHVIVM